MTTGPALELQQRLATLERAQRRQRLVLGLVLAAGIPALLVASPVGTLTTFSNGTVADASAINGNFSTITTAVNDNARKLNRQFGRYEGNGSSGGDGTGFVLTTAARTRGSGIIRANQMTNAALRNEFEALVDCWFHFSAYNEGNSTHSYTSVNLTRAAGGAEQLANNYWHEGSTMGYTQSGSVFLQAGDKIQFRDAFTPTQPTGAWFSFVAEQD